ncbi:MAG: hypothetical protein JJE42_12770 [Burkholderiales bacterium]|nr:hypothetical protein [Burkholderiales bacterium]
MIDLTQAIYDKLSQDATLVALLATYPSGSPQNPAIFTGWPIPPDATRPYVFSRGSVSDIHFDEINTNLGRDTIRDVTCIADNTGSDSAIETIAERIRTVLHRQPLTVPGGTHVMSQCIGGPFVAETDDTLTGRQLEIRIVTMEN